MVLKAYYSGGRIDVFDTDHHVDAVPQKGNPLANYTLDLSDVARDGLWLRSYYHEAADAYRGGAWADGPSRGPKARWVELPHCRRRRPGSPQPSDRGWETILARVAGELVDVTALAWAYDASKEYPSLILSALRSPDLVSPEGGKNMSEEIGVPRSVIETASREFASTDSNQTSCECRF